MRTAETIESWRPLRVTAGIQFVVAGAFSAVSWTATVEFNRALVGAAASPAATGLASALLIVGGLSLTIGYETRIGAVCIVAFLVPATIRHLLVVASIDSGAPLSELAERGQLASASKNLVLIALMLALALEARGGSRSPTGSRVAE
jgi:uncharacterized membrane protein YphA (DoxX/SURF4 family)